MREFSNEFEMLTALLTACFFGLIFVTSIYDFIVTGAKLDAQAIFGGCLLAWFTLIPLDHARHWYNEIRKVTNKEVKQ